MVPGNHLKRRSCTERQPGSSTGANRAKRARGYKTSSSDTEALGKQQGRSSAVSLLHGDPSLSLNNHKRGRWSLYKAFDPVSLLCGHSADIAQLPVFMWCLRVATASLISAGDEDWSLRELLLLTVSQASLASVNIFHSSYLSERRQTEKRWQILWCGTAPLRLLLSGTAVAPFFIA